MARKPKSEIFRNPIQIWSLKEAFLHTIDDVCPKALESLKDVFAGRTSLEEWSQLFNFDQTWIEVVAKETLQNWRQAERPDAEQLCWEPTRPCWDHDEGMQFTIDIPEVLRPSNPHFDLERLRAYLNREVDKKVDDLKRELHRIPNLHSIADERAVREVFDAARSAGWSPSSWELPEEYRISLRRLPKSELVLHLETAALYLCRGMSPEQIAEQNKEYGRDRSTLNRWIRVTLEMLELGHKISRNRPHKRPTIKVHRKE